MKERREGEKARKNMKEEAGLFPSLVLFFSSFFLLRAASLVNYLNARNGLWVDYFMSAIGPFIQISIHQ